MHSYSKIYPCLWFDGDAIEAAQFYGNLFENSGIHYENPMVVRFHLGDFEVMGLNGGPMFTISPAISLMVTCESVAEINSLWESLSTDGSIMMPIDQYPWSERYGWLVDRFGLHWQLMLGDMPVKGQKITPTFLFVGQQFGQATSAIDYYNRVFQPSATIHLNYYEDQKSLRFGQFSILDHQFVAMDGPGEHHFSFGEGFSIVVECDDQAEIDHYWNSLTADGGLESRCGWLKDRFGVSWQIIPKVLGQLMTDPERGPSVGQALMKMAKIDLATLLNA